jgi:serine-aspartate repeat-containing protein C/D/E
MHVGLRLCALALAALAMTVGRASAEPDAFASDGSSRIVWKQVFASPQNDWINQILPLRDGTYLAVGFLGREDNVPTSDWRALAVKFTAAGEVLWRREYGQGKGVDAFWAAAETDDGRIVTAGFTNRIGAGGLDAWTAVLTSDGELLREAAIGGPGYDRVTDIAKTRDGGFVLAGHTENGHGGGRDVLLVKLDKDGLEQWRRDYGGPKDQGALYVETSTDGGIVIAGGSDEQGEGDVLVMKADADGRELWRRLVGDPAKADTPHNLNLLKDGRIQMSGYTDGYGSRSHDLLSLTLSADGELLRQEVFGGADDDRAMVSGLDRQGRTWVTGYTKSAGAGGFDIFLTRLDRDGGFEGPVSTFGGPRDDNGTAVLPLPGGDLLVAAYSENLGDGGQDAVVMRVTAPKRTAPAAAFVRRRIR